MHYNQALRLLMIAYLLPQLLSGCAPSYGFTNSIFGNPLRAEFCDSVRTFVRSPLDGDGLRRAWFLPFDVYDDGSFDFYAPMSAKPMDDAASAFYEQRVGQLTHYARAPGFAFEMSKCFKRSKGFSRISRTIEEDHMRGSYVDDRSNRIIEITATGNTTGILIASADWSGDIEESIKLGGSSDREK